MTSPRAPVFSVVIATWDWSAALNLALQSVLGQTFADFEVLVVGDACSDDSAQVVAAFGDARLHWHNLGVRCGNQWGPNNYGLSVARGEYVAYLGHDDLWWPTHLANAHAVFERSRVDMVAAVALMYGPPQSGMRCVTGFFPNDAYSPRSCFFPPSSMLHRRELADRVGGWRSLEQARIAVDVDFLQRCHEAGAHIASTGEVTTFKFNASWRRNIYRTRNVDEQAAFLDRMGREGESFRTAELTELARAAAHDRLLKIEIPRAENSSAMASAQAWRQFRGSHRAKSAWQPTRVEGRRRYLPQEEFSGFEWHAIEQHPVHGAYRWSGPSTQSSLVIPERIDGLMQMTLLIVAAIHPDALASARLLVNGSAVANEFLPGLHGACLWRAQLDPAISTGDDELLVTIELDHTWRPHDLEINGDRRWLGIAVGWVEFAALQDSRSTNVQSAMS